mgnify:CR=1 FL=1
MSAKTDYYYHFGYTVFGPFLYGFTGWLRNCLKSDSIEKIFFFSRDGYMMQKAYSVMDGHTPLDLPYEYVYFSRNSLRRALLWNCENYVDSLKYLSKQRFTAFSEIASYYGLKRDEMSDILVKVGLKWEENILFESLPTNNQVDAVYQHFKDRINEMSRKQYNELVCYLKQIEMIGNCAIVDIGWHGSIQYYLECLLELSGLKTNVIGYYVGVNPVLPLKGKAKGYLFREGDLKYRKPLLCFFGGIEKLFQSLEGSTDSYEKREGKIVPILKLYEYADDNVIIGLIKDLQNGGLDYVYEAVQRCIQVENNKWLYMPLVRFGMYPTLSQTRIFHSFYTTDGEKLYFLPQKSILRYKPKEFLLALSNSMWKTGFMKEAFKIPFPYYWIYKLIRK